MTQPDGPDDRPRTGVDQIDDALTELDGIAEQPVADHHDRLSRVHESLHTALHQPADLPDDPALGTP
ncbi:hypothetical protein [Microlunatus speluncae]|uniref:hypothetical protein n=1 Tax=Microlunatus speluncae TaxID=2594267 RepID=UPI0012665780|nr:hypothetical protein [Microlunatus speluncae]